MIAPDFLVIGAQKCGTTTLFADLASHPSVKMTRDKECAVLVDADVSSGPGDWYRRQLPPSLNSELTFGDVTTSYSMRDSHPEVVKNAMQLGESLKIIYIVRDPLERIVSHHHHDFSLGKCSADINRAVSLDARFLEHSKYWYQLSPWIEAFGAHSVFVVQFEEYTTRRQESFDRLTDFLGLERFTLVSPDRILNSSQSKVVSTPTWSQFITSGIYRRIVRPILPVRVRQAVMSWVLPKAPPRPMPPSLQTIRFLMRELEADVSHLNAFTNGLVNWDLNATANRIASMGSTN